jgi:hypothetical protein
MVNVIWVNQQLMPSDSNHDLAGSSVEEPVSQSLCVCDARHCLPDDDVSRRTRCARSVGSAARKRINDARYFLAAASCVGAQLHAVLSSFETGTTCAVACWSSRDMLAMSKMIQRSLAQLWRSGADALSARAAEGVVARPELSSKPSHGSFGRPRPTTGQHSGAPRWYCNCGMRQPGCSANTGRRKASAVDVTHSAPLTSSSCF